MQDYKKKTIESYNKHAKLFSEKFKNMTDLNRRDEFQRFMNLLSGKHILDLGCGSGDHALYFLQKGLDVTCIDLSNEMIQLCKDKEIKKAFVMDIEELNFKDESFDGIWAVTSLLHIPKSKIKKVIVSINKILKKGGILFVSFKEGDGELITKDKFEGKTERFFAFWTELELIHEFKEDFVLLESQKVINGDKVYLQMFFKKI